MNILTIPQIQFLDNDGEPLSGGFVYTFAADGQTPKQTYQDLAGQVPNGNPVGLDGNGRALIWGTGQYIWRVQDQYGNLIWTAPTQDLTQSLATMFAGTAAPTSLNSGLSSTASSWWHDTGTGTIWLRDAADTTWIAVGYVNEVTKQFSANIANIANLTFTGLVAAPTQALGDASTLLATDAFVQNALNAITLSGHQATFTSSGSWTCPANTTTVIVSGCAGGGGGGGGASTTAGGGGGGAQCSFKQLLTVVPSTVYPVTIGAGGAGGASNTGGSNGTSTSLGSILTLSPGLGGSPASTGGGSGGTGGTSGATGGACTDGAGARIGFGGTGGSSYFGAGGPGGVVLLGGQSAGGFGAGGGGAAVTGQAGGSGSGGFLTLEW